VNGTRPARVTRRDGDDRRDFGDVQKHKYKTILTRRIIMRARAYTRVRTCDRVDVCNPNTGRGRVARYKLNNTSNEIKMLK